ncbi:type 1 glutamine amidotransferase [Egibacter rhizosphaerae]|uniref:Type 1 glutamine amidotransferase n=1 Tax=Egibacter rhizosphaerae TaxID=1670831 RepID=A0A411YGW9_9ACTN|nr:type 1 glutamine amidotransferase domain-containing protein [Egibacter rhizosphaerae]QBI20322.1 type 1 glutamine amidotransferase [Egibacter rhizosphaerae]
MSELTGKKALILAANLFEESELLYPLHRLREEGAEVTVASPQGAKVTGKNGYGPMGVEAAIEDASANDYDVLVIPGGFAPDRLRAHDATLELVRAFDTAGKPIGFICHAGWVPISAGIIKGRRATSVSVIKDDMVNAGTDWVDEEAVVDGNLVSARTPADLGPWLKALISTVRAA